MAASIDRWKQTADRLLIEPWRGMFWDFLAEHRAAGHLLRVDGKVLIAGRIEEIYMSPTSCSPHLSFAQVLVLPLPILR